ncbi:MAG: NRDE family protein [Bacteroidota bacterium]
MCLIAFAYKTHPKYKLIVAANRDEFYNRPTDVAHWWPDYPMILAGRDRQAGGTWMGVSNTGRFAAVTNYRDIPSIKQDALSRGQLPTDFLGGKEQSKSYAERVFKKRAEYNGFNLLVMDDELVYTGNYIQHSRVLSRGVYGLSNALLDARWPKIKQAKEKLSDLIEGPFDQQQLIDLLKDKETAPDELLPQTGLSYEKEKALSAMCIRTEGYGTCCSTALTIDYEGNVSFTEKSFAVGARKEQTVDFSFTIKPPL